VNRRQRASVRRIPNGFELRSRDRGFSKTFSRVADAADLPDCRLAACALEAFEIQRGVAVETESAVPYGSGLGGSSALLVALVAGIARIESRAIGPDEMMALCRDIESRALGVPAGTQDYAAAISGGLNVVTYGPGAVRIDRSELDLDELGRHLVLCDSGSAHSSGMNNWEVFRARVNGDAGVAAALEGVRLAAEEMAQAVASGSFEAMGIALAKEWTHRRALSARVSTPALDRAEKAARKAGAWGAKACGAGGGGVLVVLCPAGRRAEVERALRGAGSDVMETRPEPEGLRAEF